MRTGEKIRAFYKAMFGACGPQGWWPADTPFEVAVGAILTQNTNWKNVERAIENLKREGLLSPAALAAVSDERLAEVIRPAGYFRIKAKRLRNFIRLLTEDFGGSLDALFALSTPSLRETVLGVSGIGPETADSIVLYAAGRPVFVIDAYTARILHRHGLIDVDATYEDLQLLMQENLAEDVQVYKEYHALLVAVGKRHCKKAAPECQGCPLRPFLEDGQPITERQ
jgi:endonuclease-3 related protein